MTERQEAWCWRALRIGMEMIPKEVGPIAAGVLSMMDSTERIVREADDRSRENANRESEASKKD